MPDLYDVAAIGNAIVDVIAPADDAFLTANSLQKGAMMLVDEDQSKALYGRMQAGIEASGGSAGNTIAGVASFGGKAAFMGKVADDKLGEVFAHDMRAIGARFENAPLVGGPATAVSMKPSRAERWRSTMKLSLSVMEILRPAPWARAAALAKARRASGGSNR